jgi:hypothetical protein
VRCWGSTASGLLGDGVTDLNRAPVATSPVTVVAEAPLR